MALSILYKIDSSICLLSGFYIKFTRDSSSEFKYPVFDIVQDGYNTSEEHIDMEKYINDMLFFDAYHNPRNRKVLIETDKDVYRNNLSSKISANVKIRFFDILLLQIRQNRYDTGNLTYRLISRYVTSDCQILWDYIIINSDGTYSRNEILTNGPRNMPMNISTYRYTMISPSSWSTYMKFPGILEIFSTKII